MPLALRGRRPQTMIQKEGRCEEVQPSRAQRKLRVHRKGIRKHYAAQEHCATITPPSPPTIAHHHGATTAVMLPYAFWVVSIFFAAGGERRVGALSIERFDF